MVQNRRPVSVRTLAVVLALCAASGARAQVIVTPNAQASAEGNTAFVLAPIASPFRYMQLISSSEFSSLTGPVLITALAFRPDASQPGPAAALIPGAQFFLSTTSRTVTTLSTTFADNIGPDHTLVAMIGAGGGYSTGNLPGPGNTRQFDIAFPFTTPFRFDPAAGNLLLETRNPAVVLASGQSILGDAFEDTSPNAPGRSVFGSGSMTAASGNLQTAGLVTRFDYQAVPEPSSLALFGAGLAGGWLVHRRRGNRATKQ
jgi:hypothetical protein